VQAVAARIALWAGAAGAAAEATVMMGAKSAVTIVAVVVGLVRGVRRAVAKMEGGFALWILATAALEVVAVASPIQKTLATVLGYSGGVDGAIVAPAASVGHLIPRIDVATVIAVVAASTAPNVSSVAFAASAGANDNGSGWGDFEKPLEMLLEEEMEMWKEN